MLINISDKSIYLESGECKPDAACVATDREIKSLLRQNGLVQLIGDGDIIEPIEAPEATEATPDYTMDEFGPLKGTDAWSNLSSSEKMVMTRRRNQKNGPQ